jgi:hypothetical protein
MNIVTPRLKTFHSPAGNLLLQVGHQQVARGRPRADAELRRKHRVAFAQVDPRLSGPPSGRCGDAVAVHVRHHDGLLRADSGR